MNPEGAPPAGGSRFPYWSYQDLALFAALAIPCLIAGALIVQVAVWLAPAYPSSKAARLIPAQFIAYGLWFLSLYYLLKTKYGHPFWASMAWVVRGPDVAWGLFAGPAVALSVAVLGVLLHTPDIDMPMKELLQSRSSVLLMGFFAVTLGPFCEELAFRGFLMPLLARTFGNLAAIVLSALPFALLHGPQYAWSWRHMLLILLAGMSFGWVRYRTGSTAVATAMHSTYNLTFFAAFMLQERVPQIS
jgi:membrane protease YdiL (CAAX protease family)